MEIDPLYVDVTIRRWQTFTGNVAVLAATGETFGQVAEKPRGLVADAQNSETLNLAMRSLSRQKVKALTLYSALMVNCEGGKTRSFLIDGPQHLKFEPDIWDGTAQSVGIGTGELHYWQARNVSRAVLP